MKLVLSSLLLLFTSISSAQVSEQTFKEALAMQTNFNSIKQLGPGKFLVTQEVMGAHPTDPTLTRTLNLPSIIENKSDHYLITTSFPGVLPMMYDRMTNKDKFSLPDILEHHFGEGATLGIEKGEDNMIVATVKVIHTKKKPLALMGNIVKNHNSMTKAHQGLMSQHLKRYSAVKKKQMKAPLKSIDNTWLPYLAEYEKLAKFEKEPKIEGAIGFWSYNNSTLNLSYDLYNFNDRFELYITGYAGGEKEAQDYLATMEAHAAKKGIYPGCSRTEASLLPTDKTYVGVKVTYLYDGSMSVGDFVDSYKDNYYKYGQKLVKVF